MIVYFIFLVSVEEKQEQVLYLENFDLTNVVTLVKVNELRKLLEDTQFDPEKTNFLVEGFS